VEDYFRWRNEDASRNALNAHGYWMLRKRGKNVQEATNGMAGLSVAQKNELLFQNGINFNDLPQWQKRGCAIYWETFDLEAINPITKKPVTAQRRRLKRNLELPMKDEYSQFLRERIEETKSPNPCGSG
jgi:tRNA(His) guanylyltransferase